MQVGTQTPADILIKGTLVQSGDDATIALAERVGGTPPSFAQMMNEYAHRLGISQQQLREQRRAAFGQLLQHRARAATLAAALIRESLENYSLFSLKQFMWSNIRQDNRNGLLSKDP